MLLLIILKYTVFFSLGLYCIGPGYSLCCSANTFH